MHTETNKTKPGIVCMDTRPKSIQQTSNMLRQTDTYKASCACCTSCQLQTNLAVMNAARMLSKLMSTVWGFGSKIVLWHSHHSRAILERNPPSLSTLAHTLNGSALVSVWAPYSEATYCAITYLWSFWNTSSKKCQSHFQASIHAAVSMLAVCMRLFHKLKK